VSAPAGDHMSVTAPTGAVKTRESKQAKTGAKISFFERPSTNNLAQRRMTFP